MDAVNEYGTEDIALNKKSMHQLGIRRINQLHNMLIHHNDHDKSLHLYADFSFCDIVLINNCSISVIIKICMHYFMLGKLESTQSSGCSECYADFNCYCTSFQVITVMSISNDGNVSFSGTFTSVPYVSLPSSP